MDEISSYYMFKQKGDAQPEDDKYRSSVYVHPPISVPAESTVIVTLIFSVLKTAFDTTRSRL